MRIGNRDFDFDNKCYVMGILNVTPDSFSDGGRFDNMEAAKDQVSKMIAEGATIIDVGGESTRPGHEVISCEEEKRRVIPVIEMIKKNFDVVISIDTSKASVAEAAIEAGAHMVNDVWGLKADPMMAKVIAQKNVPCVLMHNRDNRDYGDLIMDMVTDFGTAIKLAQEAGVRREKIILDPGVGFAKSMEDNLKVLKDLKVFSHLGYPILLGTSRKSVIGLSLNLPVEERLEGTLATTVLGVMAGVSIFRVHDVKENKRAMDMTLKVLKAGETLEA